MARSIVEGLRRAGRRLAVVAVVGAAAASGIAAPGLASAATTADRGVADLALDVATLGKAAALKHCATPGFAADPDSVRVLYGVRQLTAASSSRTFVLRNGAGKTLLCDLFGRDRPAVLPLPTTSAAKPAVNFSNGQRRWSCDGTLLRSFRATSWLKVQDPVRSARVRYSVGTIDGPWFTAARQGRFIHLQSWLLDVSATDRLSVELQLLDGAGNPVEVPGVSGTRPLSGCASDVLIG